LVVERSFGPLLRDLRLAAGLSQEALAERAALSPQAVSALEGGRRRVPRRETVEALARALRLDGESASALAAASRHGRGAAQAAASPLELPHTSAPLVGREAELGELAAWLDQPTVRLTSLVGPGGVGKTRLALQVAIDAVAGFQDGVAWVDLSPVRDTELVAATIAARLGVHPTGPTPIANLLADHIAERRLLLVLDNLEQVPAARGLVQQILDACPRLLVLATSRVPLGLPGERVYAVAPLSVPRLEQSDPETIAGHAAVALFVERALEVVPRLVMTSAVAGAIAAICRRLDGLPLAIELAAALVRLLPPQAMLDRLGGAAPIHGAALDLLGGGAWDRPDRQQTMRDTIAWSDDLLAPEERALFRRLSVFVGGCTVAAAEAVCAETEENLDVQEGLASLLDKNLLVELEGDEAEPRLGMLETIREYAAERLEQSGESPLTRERHAAYILALVLEAEPELEGPRQVMWLQRIELDLDNIRAVLRRAVAGEDIVAGLQFASALLNFWTIRGRFSEGRNWVEQLLERTAVDGDPVSQGRARALRVSGRLAYLQGDNTEALARFEESLALYRSLKDSDGVLSGLNDVGAVMFRLGDYGRAGVLYEEALALRRERGETRLIAQLLNNLATSAFAQGDFARGIALSEESLDLLRELDDRYSIAVVLTNLGQARLEMGDFLGAAAACGEGLPVARELQASDAIARFLSLGGSIARQSGDYDQARRRLSEALALYQELGAKDELWRTLEELAFVALATKQFERSVLLLAGAAVCYDLAGTLRSAAEQVAYDDGITAASSVLGAEKFHAAWAQGHSLSLEDVLALGKGAS
jgi:predicted ATPase/DNA-binding XRE family transcriptional regulator